MLPGVCAGTSRNGVPHERVPLLFEGAGRAVHAAAAISTTAHGARTRLPGRDEVAPLAASRYGVTNGASYTAVREQYDRTVRPGMYAPACRPTK